MNSNQTKKTTAIQIESEFSKDILEGLSRPNKCIPSKYFYDAVGSKLFEEITHNADYYLTNCELDILNLYKNTISKIMQGEKFNLIELGPGEGLKTKILIEQFLQESLSFTYTPIDISDNYLKKIVEQFQKNIPQLHIEPINADYFVGLKLVSLSSSKRNLVLFLGSSIGNFDSETTNHFIKRLKDSLNPNDYVLIGFDLRKDIKILQLAYNDREGITEEFNMNLLRRINKELGANFKLDKFQHYAPYDAKTGAMESYLISLEKQSVYIDALSQTFQFEAYESIHVESSYKYLLSQIEEMAHKQGFNIVQHFFDKKKYFVDSLWKVT